MSGPGDIVEVLRRIRTSKDRDEAAWTYAQAIAYFGPADLVWPEINRAILDRWTMSGLHYIKREAWKLNKIWERAP